MGDADRRLAAHPLAEATALKLSGLWTRLSNNDTSKLSCRKSNNERKHIGNKKRSMARCE